MRAVLPSRSEAGSVLVMTLGLMTATGLFLSVLVGFTIQQVAFVRSQQDGKAAIAAAQAGVSDYLARLDADSDYWRQQNADGANPAFSTAGRSVQGAAGSTASYAYRVLDDVATIQSRGFLRIRSTGTSGLGRRVSRSLVATLTPSNASGLAFVSDKEVIDPDVMLNHTESGCDNYWYGGRSSIPDAPAGDDNDDDDYCRNLPWTSADRVQGGLHSNDALKITGKPTFTGPRATSSWPTLNGSSATKTWWSTGTAPLGGLSPSYAAAISLPSSGTTSYKAYTSPATTGAAGCYYTGVTKIVFTGSTMSVLSPGTTNASTPARCLNVSNRNQVQTGLAIPPVIYVDAGTASCTFGAIGYPAPNEHYENDGASEVAWDDPSDGVWGWLPNYSCRRGTAYVSGTAASSVTVATQDDVVITGDVKVDSLTGSTMIGLIARSCVWIWHPITQAGDNVSGVTPVSTIQASITAQQHSFLTTYWSHGATIGALTVTGQVTTKYRGPMYSSNENGNHGYTAVKYVYDTRLASTPPPYYSVTSSSAGSSSGWAVSGLSDG